MNLPIEFEKLRELFPINKSSPVTTMRAVHLNASCNTLHFLVHVVRIFLVVFLLRLLFPYGWIVWLCFSFCLIEKLWVCVSMCVCVRVCMCVLVSLSVLLSRSFNLFSVSKSVCLGLWYKNYFPWLKRLYAWGMNFDEKLWKPLGGRDRQTVSIKGDPNASSKISRYLITYLNNK